MIWGSAALSFLVSLVVVLAVERHAVRLRLIDRPNERSSHVVPRPRGGGLGIIAGTCAGLAVAWLLGAVIGSGVWIVILGAGIVAAVGLWDDVASLSPLPRLVAQIGAAALVIWGCGGIERLPLPSPLDIEVGGFGVVLSIVWIVAVTNFFNFMDGADGLAAGQAGLTLLGLAVVLWPMPAATAATVLAAAAAAFLLRNWSPARIFLGDVGSGWLGFVLAALPLAAPVEQRAGLILLAATSLALFLVDPTVTLAERWWRGAHLMASHREHAYQRLFAPADGHGRVVGMLLAAAASTTMLAIFAFWRPDQVWWTIVWAGAVCTIERVIAVRLTRGRFASGRAASNPAGGDPGPARGRR